MAEIISFTGQPCSKLQLISGTSKFLIGLKGLSLKEKSTEDPGSSKSELSTILQDPKRATCSNEYKSDGYHDSQGFCGGTYYDY